MKIWWIVNILFGPIERKIRGTEGNGLWIGALLHGIQSNHNVELSIITTAPVKEIIKVCEHGVSYFAIPSQWPAEYNANKRENVLAWETMAEREKPDLIHVWGTEFSHVLTALRVLPDIPAVVFIQGYAKMIARHYYAGLSKKEIISSITIRDIIKRDSIILQKKKFISAASNEEEVLKRAGHVIVENDWCENHIKCISENIKAFRCPLPISEVFSQFNWNIGNIERHTVICNASGYPLKGLHMLLKALRIVKKRYSDVKLLIPGSVFTEYKGVESLKHMTGYGKIINSMIRDFELEDNITWLGTLTQKELATRYATSHVFTMVSAIENHSSSLKEAMMVGTPCVASNVGGVSEYVDKQNGMLYRFEEYESLAYSIMHLFEDDSLCQSMSTSGKHRMNEIHTHSRIDEIVMDIYSKVMGGI